MLDAIKTRLARRSALKLTERRTVRPWNPNPAARRALVVLPAEEIEAKEAWRFLNDLGIPSRQIVPVVPSSLVPYAPADFIGRVKRMDDKALTMLGLPKPAFAGALWQTEPDLAFCLTPEFDLAAATLTGASPAAFRIGLYAEAAEPFFDLMVAPGDSFASTLWALHDTLARIEPPVV
ncbi:MAG: hypothetical protein AAGI91_12585 [Bacteroidota bacterium]